MLLIKNGGRKWLGLQVTLNAGCAEPSRIAQLSTDANALPQNLTQTRTTEIPNSTFLLSPLARVLPSGAAPVAALPGRQ
jgi:hypothetical protein